MDKIQQYYYEANQGRRQQSRNDPSTPTKMPAIASTHRRNRVDSLNFQKHVAGQSQFNPVKGQRTERSRAITELVQEKGRAGRGRSPLFDRNTSLVPSIENNASQEAIEMSSSLDKITQALSKKRAQMQDIILMNDFRPSFTTGKRKSKQS